MSVCLCRLGHGLMAMEVQAGPGAVLTLPPDGHGSPGRLWSSPHSPTSTWPWVQVSMYMLLRSSVQDFHIAVLSLLPALQPVKQVHLPFVSIQYINRTTHSTGRIAASVSSLPLWVSFLGTQIPTWWPIFSFYRTLCLSLLKALVVQVFLPVSR